MTPQLRFPEFTDEWQVKKLGESLESISSGKSNTTSNGIKYPIYGSTGEIGKSATFDYSGDKLLIARVGANAGSMYRVSGSYKVSDNTLIVNLKDDADTSFVQYSLINFNINRLVFGSGQPLVTGGMLKNTKLAFPSKPEQEKIADFLTAVDERIRLQEQKLAKLEQYKRGVMQQIFSQKIRFKDENGNPYLNWDYKEMNEIFNEITDKVGDKNIETFSITAGRGFVSQTEKFGKDISGMQNQRYTLLAEDDFAYNKGNSKTYSYGCVYKNSQGKEIAVPNVFISFRLKDKLMTPGYFEQLFINHYLDEHLRKLISSGARMDGLLNVNKKDFFEINIPVPSNVEQQKIATFLTTLDARITAEKSRLTATREFKKALLQRMFA